MGAPTRDQTPTPPPIKELAAMTDKDYLTYENTRNRKNHALYSAIFNQAFPQCRMTLIVHHLSFQLPGKEPNEVPSADSLLFDHDIMRACFGDDALPIMAKASQLPCEERDEYVKQEFESRFGPVADFVS